MFPAARKDQKHVFPTRHGRLHGASPDFGNLLGAARWNVSLCAKLRPTAVAIVFLFAALLPLFGPTVLAQPQQSPEDPSGQTKVPGTAEPSPQGASEAQPERYGVLRGRIVGQTGVGLASAKVQLKCAEESTIREVQSDRDGRFSFGHVPPGPFQLTVAEEGFASQTISNALQPGEDYFVPPISMRLATVVTEIRVTPSTEEIAQDQFKQLEQQRVLHFVPDFYVSYVPDAVPLTTQRKFQLALKATTDPVTTLGVAIVAGVDQADDRFSGYGQGAHGYAKRYGASYANFASGLLIGGAVLPSILKQDPRYFYKGTGSKHSRFLYAISRPFICKGDNQRWQPNYSSVLGDIAAGGISNLYIPERDHHGARLTFENAGIALGASAVINVLREFVLYRLTARR